jgi:uncharacterized protein (DUF305 family)
MRRLAAMLALALLALTGLTGCAGGDDDTGAAATREAPSDTEHNDADVAFATDMIPHHAQALVMVDLSRGRPLDPEVASLMEQIQAAQTPEIQTMAGWLTSWGEDIPATTRDHVHGGDHGAEGADAAPMGDMPGMMSAEDMDALEAADDGAFQRQLLEMMVAHHEGAIEMAQTELEQGRYQPALDLAQAVIEGQTAEIETMQALLAG